MNYITLSLTCVLRRVLEGIIRNEFFKNLFKNSLIAAEQYGFVDTVFPRSFSRNYYYQKCENKNSSICFYSYYHYYYLNFIAFIYLFFAIQLVKLRISFIFYIEDFFVIFKLIKLLILKIAIKHISSIKILFLIRNLLRFQLSLIY